MSSLEEKLRELAARGELTHLSICTVAGKGPNSVDFSASYSPASVDGSGFGCSADPVAAIEEALIDPRLKRLHAKLAKATKPAATSVPVTKPEPSPEKEPWE